MHDDRLKVWFAERLSPEEYAASKKAGFVYFYGQKCFSCVWRPRAQDFIEKHGIEIQVIAEADDVAARVDRFDKYAGNAEGKASNAAERLESGAANTERRARFASTISAREFSKAEYWQNRIAAAIAHADFKEDSGLIFRRIEGLETELRKHRNAQAVDDSEPASENVWMGGKGRGQGYWRKRSDVPAVIAYHQRWIDHLSHRLEYEQARLAATGGTLAKMASNELLIEVGGAVEATGFPLSVRGWYLVTKINPASIEVFIPEGMKRFCNGCTWVKITRDQVLNVATPAQVESGETVVEKPAHKKPTIQHKETQKTHQGQTPERLGAFPRSSFSADDGQWYLITKVNKISVDYITLEKVQSGTETRERILGGKCSIGSLRNLKTPAQVAEDHPELLAAWDRVQAIRKRKKELATTQPAEVAQ